MANQMQKEKKKKLRNLYREEERKAAFNALPLSVSELKQMFDMLDIELPKQGCKHTRDLTQAWLESRGHNVNHVFAWLDTVGGFCDCEILANVEEHVDEAAK